MYPKNTPGAAVSDEGKGKRLVASMQKKREHNWLVLLAAGLLPLILGVVFTFLESQEIEQRQRVNTAGVVLDHAENISDRAWSMVRELEQFPPGSCDTASNQIQRLGSLKPYFRSVGLVQGNEVLCSSAYGQHPGTASNMVRGSLPTPLPNNWIKSLSGTAGAPERPAVIYMRQQPTGNGAFAIVDGQYLLDFMEALGTPRDYQISLQFNQGYRIQTGEVAEDNSLLFSSADYQASSWRYPISANVVSPASAALHTWRQTFMTFLPMAVILSILFMALASNWLKRRISFQDEIRRGIVNNEFSVNYQPVYNTAIATYGGAEALMRWQRRNGEWVRPDIFIAAAEAEGMIIPLTQHLLDLVAKDVASWNVPAGFHLAINVAAGHLQHPCFESDIRQFAQKISSKKLILVLELTERSLISEGKEVAKKLAMLRLEGIEIAIDDFGTGNCSLSYLQTFQLDYLKIDRGFINAIESVDGETPVLDAIINLSHKLALQVLGEGVETPMQFEYLKNHGVTFIQGYLYARPMSSESLTHWLANEGSQPFIAQ